MSIKVGINGFGVIGRRVAYAVNKQEDMELVGVGKTSPDYKAKIGPLNLAARNGHQQLYRLFNRKRMARKQ